MIWEDILMEHGGEETVNYYKNKYANYNIENLLELAFLSLELETENHPCRHQIIIGDYLDKDEYTAVYESNVIEYQELLVALITLLQLINIEHRPKLIIDLAQALQKMDREVSDQFAKDLAEKVYRQYR